MLYSKLTSGFYTKEIHGGNIPADAVEITQEEYRSLLAGQAAGKRISADADGKPILTDPDPLTPNQITISQIVALESTVTERRIRESVLGIDDGWLQSLNDKIVALRVDLT